ncbi:hypothetical protein LSAT2_000460 [Lamellibrachia satsuma]|nr:hypothetical protein LSAT2_000460 [Lamellibrachia satsuma]
MRPLRWRTYWDSKKNKSSRGRQGDPRPPANEYKKLPRDEERKQRPDSGVFSSGSDSEEQLPLLDDETTAPRETDTIADCEYCFYPRTPQTVRGGFTGKSGIGLASGDVDERKQEGQICSESTVLPKDDFDKFWDDCCRGRTSSDASNVSSDEGIQSGGAASSGEESDEEVLWQSFVEKIKIWRMEDVSPAAPGSEENGIAEKQNQQEEEELETGNMENEEDQLLLKPADGERAPETSEQEKTVAKLAPSTAGDAASEGHGGDSQEVATAVLVEIDGDGEYRAGEDPALWMDDEDEDEDEDVVWQVNNKTELSVKYFKGKKVDSHDDVIQFISKNKERYNVDDVVETETTVEAALLNPWKTLGQAGKSIKNAVGKQHKPKKFMCCSVM